MMTQIVVVKTRWQIRLMETSLTRTLMRQEPPEKVKFTFNDFSM